MFELRKDDLTPKVLQAILVELERQSEINKFGTPYVNLTDTKWATIDGHVNLDALSAAIVDVLKDEGFEEVGYTKQGLGEPIKGTVTIPKFTWKPVEGDPEPWTRVHVFKDEVSIGIVNLNRTILPNQKLQISLDDDINKAQIISMA